MTAKEDQDVRYWPTVRAWTANWRPARGIRRATTARQCLNCGKRTSLLVRGFCVPCRERFPA